MPPDGRGWGRGLMQIDYGGHLDLCLRKLPSGIYAWEDPQENMAMSASLLHALLTQFSGAEDAAAAGYNAGAGHVFQALEKAINGADRRQALDQGTEHNDYCTDVLRRAAGFQGLCV